MGCGSGEVVAGILRVAAVIAEHRDELVELDRVIGDADHGENLNRGFSAVLGKLGGAELAEPAAVLKLTATTLISTVGGAAGPLYGTALLRAATAVAGKPDLDGASVATAISAALEGVVARGKAVVGDKTMVDALTPAARAAAEAAESGAGPSEVLAAAAEAAGVGALSTIPLVARKGRASYLGERSADHLDPGARSTTLILQALARTAGS